MLFEISRILTLSLSTRGQNSPSNNIMSAEPGWQQAMTCDSYNIEELIIDWYIPAKLLT